MPKTTIKTTIAAVLTAALLAGCAPGPVTYVNSDVDFSFIRRAAVLPFQNLSGDRFAAERMESVFLAELLTYDGLAVVDPGEVVQAWSELRFGTDAPLSAEQVAALGERLGVDAVFTGSIEEYGLERLGGGQAYAVTAVFGMAETVTGSKVWSVQVHADGSSLWRKLFGGRPKSLYEVSRIAVRDALDTLMESGGGSDDRTTRRH